MSRIGDLIAELAPNGVEFKALGEVGKFIRGNGLQKSDLTDEGAPAIHYGQIHTYYGTWSEITKSFTDPARAEKLRRAKSGDLIIATTSEDNAAVAKATAWMGAEEVAVSGDAYIYRHTLDPRYVAYFFQSHSFQSQKARHITGAKVRRISGDSLAKIRIPVPPFEVQQEIARILDQFLQLEAELESELRARRRQYEFYRDEALQFDADASLQPLGDVILNLRTGLNPRKNFSLNTADARNYYITVRELTGFNVRWTEKTDRIDDSALSIINRRSRLTAGDVLFSATGTIGRTAVVSEEPRNWNIKEGVYALTPDPGKIRPRYLVHLIHSRPVLSTLESIAMGGTVKSVSMADLRNVNIPVPSLEIQDELTTLLDDFDLLVNDHSFGLPAEINARHKQYEYYRERLLTFEEARA